MNFDKLVMNKLHLAAEEAFVNGEVPVSAIVFDLDMNIVSCCCNNRQSTGNILGHAEILAILEAERKVGDWRLNGYRMLVNLRPCEMCSAVIRESRLDRVYFLVDKPDNDVNISDNFVLVDGYDEEKSYYKNLLTDFFNNMR